MRNFGSIAYNRIGSSIGSFLNKKPIANSTQIDFKIHLENLPKSATKENMEFVDSVFDGVWSQENHPSAQENHPSVQENQLSVQENHPIVQQYQPIILENPLNTQEKPHDNQKSTRILKKKSVRRLLYNIK